jgi:hypothetical protein
MLLAATSTMNRKSLALAIVLLIAGLAPATAIIGFCARMPCCSHASEATAAFSTERNDCCTTIACYESPSATFATAGSTPLSLIVTPLITRDVPALHAPGSTIAAAVADTSPPRCTSDRLAVLSTLLI